MASIAVPTEHGGWSFTLEPVLLGLLVGFSWPGVLLGLAALVGFVVRTPLKIALVDRRRHRQLGRTILAQRVAVIEVALLLFLVALVLALVEDRRFLIPLAAAIPFVGVGFWYDVRSRSRRLVPELAGTIGIGSVAAAVALIDGVSAIVAIGLWLAVAARAVAAVVFVRVQLRRAKSQKYQRSASDAAQALVVIAVAAGAWFGVVPWIGWGAIAILAGAHLWLIRRPPPSIAMVGAQQVVLGLFVVLTVGLASIAP